MDKKTNKQKRDFSQNLVFHPGLERHKDEYMTDLSFLGELSL